LLLPPPALSPRACCARASLPVPCTLTQGHGIIGCFRFTDSYYLLVVARREYVGHICGARAVARAWLRARACACLPRLCLLLLALQRAKRQP
jgi:hypothetical protein